MTSTILVASILALIWSAGSSKNPLKVSAILLILSGISFLNLKMNNGTTWVPIILFLIFTGGILMAFMILSSILPNEKAMKLKFPKVMAMLVFTSTMIGTMDKTGNKEILSEMKSVISSPPLFGILTGVIMIYFFLSISLNEEEMGPMRSFQCRYTGNFVNY